MSRLDVHSEADTAEALGAGVTILPPQPGQAPLATTSRDAGGLEVEEDQHIHNHDTPPPASKSATSPSPESDLVPPRPPLSKARLFGIAAIVSTTMMMNAAGNMSLNIALPTIQKDLNMRLSDLQWISSAYGLTNGCFLLLAGRLADVFGRRLLFLCGLVWFTTWTIVGGFMKNGAALVVTRAFSGIGAAMSVPSAVGIIASNFTGRAKSTAFSAFAAGAPVGGGLGLVLGGVLTTYAPTTWRATLWVLSGMAVAIAVLAFFILPPDILQTKDRRIDWVGAALVTIGLIFLQFVISDGQAAPEGWKTPYIIAMLILAIFLIASFFAWEWYIIHKTTRPPLMRLSLWTRANGRLASVYFIGFISWMGFSSVLYHATLWFQDIQQTGPIGAMVRFLPTSVWGVLCNVIVAYLIASVPTQWLVCSGIVATGISNVLMALAPPDKSYWGYPFNAMWLSVTGADFLMATGSIFVSALALAEEQSVAGALFQTLVQIGGSFGLSLTTVIADAYNTKALNAGKSAILSELDGLRAAFWLGAGCSFSAMILAMVSLRGMGSIGKGIKKGKKEEVVTVDNGNGIERSGEEKV